MPTAANVIAILMFPAAASGFKLQLMIDDTADLLQYATLAIVKHRLCPTHSSQSCVDASVCSTVFSKLPLTIAKYNKLGVSI
jgi:hypothetical protein